MPCATSHDSRIVTAPSMERPAIIPPPAFFASGMMPRIANRLKNAAPAISARNAQRASSSSNARRRIAAGVAPAIMTSSDTRNTAAPISQPITARRLGLAIPGIAKAAMIPAPAATRKRGRDRTRLLRCRGRTGGASMVIRLAAPQSEPGDLDRRAAIHDDPDALRLGACRRFVVAHPELHPYHLGADRDRRVDRLARGLRPAKHVDHVDALRDLGEAGITALAMDRAARRERVDRDRAVALALQIPHDPVARPLRPRDGADHRDGFPARQNVAQILVR